jgi:predicted metal-dependent phosphoesterase TrpH
VARQDKMTDQVREPRFPPGRAAGRGRGWYRGDCHVHSARSQGGELTPEQLAAAARASGLDFIAITEHNTADTHGAWGQLAGDDLLVILGQEATTLTGHWLALGIGPGQVVEWRYGVRHDVIGRYLSQVRQAGGLCVAAHPHAPYPGGVFMYPFDGFDAVEVWNGLWSSDRLWNADNNAAVAEWARALAAGIRGGRWLPAIGGSDTHLDGQIAVPQTVVLADELGTRAVLAGIRAGRSWIAGSAAVDLSLHVRAGGRGAGIGERLETCGEPALVRTVVSGVPSGTVSFHTDRGAVHRESLPTEGPGTIEWRTSAEESGFVRVEVRQPGQQMAALTNPIILS